MVAESLRYRMAVAGCLGASKGSEANACFVGRQ
jgi:hypothetical protein